MFPKNCIEPSNVAAPVAYIGRSTPLTYDKAALGRASRNLGSDNAEQQNNAIPNHELGKGIQNKLNVAHHMCRGVSDQALRGPAPASYYALGLSERPASKSQRRVNAPHPFHAHSAWQGRPLSSLSCDGGAVDDPSFATASLWRVSSLNSATSRVAPFSSRCQCAAQMRLCGSLLRLCHVSFGHSFQPSAMASFP
jgi:hypothetical protein